MFSVIQGVSGISVNRQPNLRELLSHGGHELVILAGLDLQFDPLVTAAQLLFHLANQRFGILAYAK